MIRRKLILAALCGGLLAACGSSSPTAVPVPTPTPTPKPEATPVPLLAGCNLPPMPDLHGECPHLQPQFTGQVETAIKQLFQEHPEMFDFDDTKGGGVYSYKVRDRRTYTHGVVVNLQAQGLCADDQKEEIAVKNSQEFNEQYNVWTSDGYVRLPPGAYITTCFPAQF